jgi:AhpD family alkylhydroperoxidase
VPLVEPIAPENAPLLALPFYGGGDPGPITATLAHVPELLEVALPFIGKVLSPSSIPFRTKEIVILRTSALLACRYCIDSHTPVALDSGLTHEQVHLLRDAPAHDGSGLEAVGFDVADRALIAWVDAVALGPGPVAPAVGAAMRAQFPEHAVVELTLLTSTTLLLNRYATSLQLPVGEATIARLAQEGFSR